MKKKEVIIKSCFYLISLTPLFILLTILTFDFSKGFRDNSFAVFSMFLILASLFALWFLNDLRKDAKNLPLTVIKASNINYENLTFLATYIIPLVAIPLDSRIDKVIFVILFLFIGVIFVRTNIFYSNPSLAILGYSIYRIDDISGKYIDSVVILQGNLKKNDKIKCLRLSDNIYYGKKTT